MSPGSGGLSPLDDRDARRPTTAAHAAFSRYRETRTRLRAMDECERRAAAEETDRRRRLRWNKAAQSQRLSQFFESQQSWQQRGLARPPRPDEDGGLQPIPTPRVPIGVSESLPPRASDSWQCIDLDRHCADPSTSKRTAASEEPPGLSLAGVFLGDVDAGAGASSHQPFAYPKSTIPVVFDETEILDI